MSDKYDAKAEEIALAIIGKRKLKVNPITEEGETFGYVVSEDTAVIAIEAIASALRSAAAEEREAILKDISTIELSESKDRVSPKKTYSLGDLWEAYYTGAHALHNAAIQLIRSRGITND